MKKLLIAATSLVLVLVGYACKDEDNPATTPSPVLLTATLNSQPTSGSLTTSTATGTFQGELNQSSTTSNVLSYTINYSGVTPTAISLDPVSASTTSGTSSYSNGILLAGAFPTTTTSPGSGTSTSPGSGTSTSPGSGTSTTPGSGTSTLPGSGTSTSPGSGTAIAITPPLSGTISLSQGRADSLRRSLYRLNIRSTNYPNGEIGGTVLVR